MNLTPAKIGMAMVAVALASMITASAARAQLMQGPSGASTNTMQNLRASQDQLDILQNVETHSTIDPKETEAYKKFFAVSPQDTDKKIKLGTNFLQRYPKSVYAEAVEVGLTNAYLSKQDFKDFFATADRALALNPNEVDVLTSVGWVIPHVYDPKAPDAAKQLAQAETDEKRAISLLEKMKDSRGESKADFAASRSAKMEQAHSALGLIYFRRGEFADSAKELQLSTQGSSDVDATDVFVLGVDLQNLNRHAEAAKAFARCGQMSGPLQGRCKQSADQEGRLAGGGQ